ncbi:MAG: hypothetical protein SFU99_05225 [Saprospiraceae bacterium]|nr:hypothetical protein [Saprospiraceae bacterium]
MKSLILSLGTLFLLVVSVEFASAQATATCKPEDCAKVCKPNPNCNPADCAKICADKPNCKPENCASASEKTANASSANSGVAAAIAILVNNKNGNTKTSCCSKAASVQETSCTSSAASTKIAAVQKEAKIN